MNCYNITNKISRLVEENHVWSSTILLPDGDRCIDISSAAMGTASLTPSNAAKQPDVYPTGRAASVYCFDPDIYGQNSWMQYTRFAWAGGTFFPVVLLCQFFVLAGNRF
jgi:hypothetical protein